MYLDGVAVYNETLGTSHGYESEFLLCKAKGKAYDYSCQCSGCRDDDAFIYEYVGNGLVVGAHAAQGVHVVALLNYQHGQRTNDVEAGNKQYESKEYV